MNEQTLTPDDAFEAHAREGAEKYGSTSIKVLRDFAHIRERPGMYIGDTGKNGLHHLIYELVHNCVDEALAGYCRNIDVVLHVDGSCSVKDDGRGIPVDMHAEGKSTLELVMTTVGAGGKFDNKAYKVSAGLHGMGAKAVNALSEWTEAQVRRNGRTYTQEYERGQATTEVKDIGVGKGTGTKITFKPDRTIFRDESAQFDYDVLEVRFRELAFLNKSLAIKLIDEVGKREELFKYEGGVAEFVKHINKTLLDAKESVLNDPPLYIDRAVTHVKGENETAEIRVEVAMQFTNSDEERFHCYTNNARNPMGGRHLSGFREGLTRALKNYGTKNEMFNKVTPIGEDFRKGLTVVISLQHPSPQFNSQTKEKLNNEEVENIVATVVTEYLTKFLEENPKEASRIMKHVLLQAEAREAEAKARKALKERKGLLTSGGLPGKLFDCSTRDRDASELFLVEGDSAGGSAESGRDRNFQAILPLRGKPLNVEKARLEKLVDNNEISSLIGAIGIDIGIDIGSEKRDETMKDLRYGKIIIMSDADVDGQHIRTLLLTFFYRQMPILVAEGRIYIARPPLYKVTEKKNVRFVQEIPEMNEQLIARGMKGTKLAMYPRVDPRTDPTAPPPAPTRFEADQMKTLIDIVVPLESALQTLEKRGVNLPTFFSLYTDKGLPTVRVVIGGKEQWCRTAVEVDELREAERKRLGRDLVIEEAPGAAQGNGHAPMAADTFYEQDFHEVRAVNKALEQLVAMGFDVRDLLPQERVAGREPVPRLKLEAGDSVRSLNSLRELVSDLRRLGEKGLSITRFKGLGEMDADELWSTTLDPAKRKLMRVNMDDVLKADELFRTLMGEKVEPRRDFIYKHAIEVKEIDYHGA